MTSHDTAKRVLVGACGMGQGHISQQLILVKQLLERGHRVSVVTFNDGLPPLEGAFSPPVPVAVPTHFPGGWVSMSGEGIDISRTAANARAQDPRGDAWNFGLCEQVVEQLGGAPDVVFSDYEPASAQIAYMLGSRLITTEQQSKFLLYRTPDAGGYTREDEAGRLRYFFPAADERIASSFFAMEWERDDRYTGRIIEPILRPEVLNLTPEADESSVLVYLSPFGPTRQSLDKMLQILAAARSDLKFTVFTKASVTGTPANVEVRPFDGPAFTAALASSSAVISTAGHQLLSECVYLGKPVLTVPFDNYEQQFNAMMVERLGIGANVYDLSPELVRDFLARRDEFAGAARALAARRFTGDSAGLLDRLGL